MLLQSRRILLILGGGVAAYKSLELIRRMRDAGARVQPLMTKAAHQFVTPLSVAALAEAPVFSELFDLKEETEIGHIRLSREADLIVIAPATANLLARMAHGLADELATAVLLAANTPILAAPAMNWRMWENPATQRNLALLRADGVQFIGPTEGAMACNEHGLGRMAEPDAILAAAAELLGTATPHLRAQTAALHNAARLDAAPAPIAARAPLAGRHVLVTAGPTFEPIDPVRFIGNRSSGKQGYAIAAAAQALGARVTLVAGPGALPDPPGVSVVHVETANAMLAAVEAALPADIAVFAAAVADWRTAQAAPEKLKKSPKNAAPSLALVENPDILSTIARKRAGRPPLVIGFAAETENVLENAKKKRAAKGCDWIVANDVSEGEGVFGGDRNTVHLITAGGVESWPPMSKTEVAEALMRKAASHLRTQAAAE
jgi:phosphopantothenoylcysteine decarboxylase/phosphopantothenate--cysteine ligase